MQHVRSTFRPLMYTIFRIALLRIIFVQGLLPVRVILTQHRYDLYHTTSKKLVLVHKPCVLWLLCEDAVPEKPSKEAALREEASALLEKADAIRKQLPVRIAQSTTSKVSIELRTSKWNVLIDDDSSRDSTEYRLYVDIGREDGTWMDPRWGASQRRIEFTMDVQFQPNTNVSQEQQQRMIQDNIGGTSSPTYHLRIAPYARLRNGFDDMKCHVDGAYRIDTQNTKIQSNSSRTLRFYITTDGKNDVSYGDIYIPTGEMYFSLPCFGNNDPNAIQNLSIKDGIVSIRQIGWHTGWRRMESRIIGTFRATPIDIAKQRDRF